MDGSDAGSAALHAGAIRNYVWVSPAKIAHWVPDARGAGTLALVDLASGSSEVMASNTGPSLHLRPRTGALTFVASSRAGNARIRELDPSTRKVTTYAPTVDGGDALAWTPSGRRLMASSAKLFVRENETDRWIRERRSPQGRVDGDHEYLRSARMESGLRSSGRWRSSRRPQPRRTTSVGVSCSSRVIDKPAWSRSRSISSSRVATVRVSSKP